MRKHWLIGGLAGTLALAGLAFVRAQEAEQAQDTAAVETPEDYPSGQPIAFPHNQHAGFAEGQNRMDCMYCHFSAERSVDAGIPAVSVCAGCHIAIPGTNNPDEIRRVMEHFASREPIPWVRIYKVADHVHFPHMRHIAAGLTCQQCHGQVQEMTVLNGRDPAWGGDNMGWCVSCHRDEGASTDCAVCHY
jgi:hypothetical protein